jgi:hypothetical protein
MSTFDPHNNDAMFARVLAKLDEHGEVLDDIRKAGQQTEREIESLKSWRDNFQGRVTVLATLISLAAAGIVSLIVSLYKN